jgi:CBS-domain-containing membrane protein
LLSSVPVSAAMTSPVVTIPDWLTVEQFLESIAPQHAFTTYPVHDPSGKLTGIVRLGDLMRMPTGARAEARLRDRARPIAEVPVARPDEDLAALIQRVGASLDQRVLVFDGERLVGIVSPVDVARVLAIRQTTGRGGTPAAAATRGST